MYVRKVFACHVSEVVSLPKLMLKALDIHRGDMLWVSAVGKEIRLKKIVDFENEIRNFITGRDRGA